MGVIIIVDILMLALIVFFIWHGYRRGLVHSAAGLLSTIIAGVTAWILANALAQPLSDIISPMLEPAIGRIMEAAAENSDVLPHLPDSAQIEQLFAAAAEALKSFGLSIGIGGSGNAITDAITQNISEKGQSFIEAMTSSVSHAISFAGVLVFGFIAVRAILEIGVGLVASIFKLPVLNFLNKLGGAVIGLLQGLLILFAIGWAAQFVGFDLDAIIPKI